MTRPTNHADPDYEKLREAIVRGEIVLRGDAAELRANNDLLISSYFGEHTELFASG